MGVCYWHDDVYPCINLFCLYFYKNKRGVLSFLLECVLFVMFCANTMQNIIHMLFID